MKKIEFEGYTYIDGGVCAAEGFTANGICCGLSHENSHGAHSSKNDLAVIFAQKDCAAAAVYTVNKVKGAPITVTKKHLENGIARAVIVNSVNANCCNADGEEKAQKMCSLVANALNIPVDDVIVASTGVIGQTLQIAPIENAMEALCAGLSREGNAAACQAIMTTDTMKKEIAVEFMLDGKKCRLGGMLKGSGMIHPNMATTLTFLTTDAAVSSEMLSHALSDVVRITLNRASVDGDTSTNDMVCIMASAMAGNPEIKNENASYEIFRSALYAVMMNLARMMARDGEGATKLLECICTGAPSEKDAEKIAKSIITSSLFKSAMFGGDANWGRILCAAGYSGADFDVDATDVRLCSVNGEIHVCKNGAGTPFSEEKAKEILSADEIRIKISVGSGCGSAVCWGCDLTYDYVKINGDYRS